MRKFGDKAKKRGEGVCDAPLKFMDSKSTVASTYDGESTVPYFQMLPFASNFASASTESTKSSLASLTNMFQDDETDETLSPISLADQ